MSDEGFASGSSDSGRAVVSQGGFVEPGPGMTKAADRIYRDDQVLRICDLADYTAFLEMVGSDAGLAHFKKQIRKLVIHLDARELTLATEDKLAMALNCLHPIRPNPFVAINPHRIETIVFVIDGDILFTRYNYVLTSPTQYGKYNNGNSQVLRTNALVCNARTPAEKKKLVFQVTSSEKLVASALLGLRGIKNVFFDTTLDDTGKGRVEGRFRQTLEETLVCAPSFTEECRVSSRHTGYAMYATVDMNSQPPNDFDKVGCFRSTAYDNDPDINPYRPGMGLDTKHINANDGFTLYNMVATNPQTTDFANCLEPTELHDTYLSWKIATHQRQESDSGEEEDEEKVEVEEELEPASEDSDQSVLSNQELQQIVAQTESRSSPEPS